MENFNQAIDVWLDELEKYSFEQLCNKPSSPSWSMGQLYVHLIEVTEYCFRQVRICATCNDNETEEMKPEGRAMFLGNSFPDARLEGPPSNGRTKQPLAKELLKNGLLNLKKEMAEAGMVVVQTHFNGRTKHPGLGYFNAAEWFQFAEMHLRHHFRQKNRIDEFLKTNVTSK